MNIAIAPDTRALAPQFQNNLAFIRISTAHRHQSSLIIEKFNTLYSSQGYTTIADIPSSWVDIILNGF